VSLNILFIGDVVGRPGREALEDRLASLRAELEASVCIVNGENVADGVGITPKLADRLLAPEPTRSRSETTPGAGRRSAPTSPSRSA